MSKTQNAREKRMRNIAESALKVEIDQNEKKIPEIIPESSLFSVDNGEKPKKKKLFISPRKYKEEKPSIQKVEYNDIWGDETPSGNVKSAKKASLPKSSDSYRSSDLANKKKTVLEIIGESIKHNPDPAQNEHKDVEDGIGDSLAGESPVGPSEPVKISPAPKSKPEKSTLKVNANIPSYLPAENRKKIRTEINENRKILLKMKDEQTQSQFEKDLTEKTDIEENNDKEPKQKIDPLERFIIDEPEYEQDSAPSSLSELSGDKKQFARLQRSFEVRRKVGLHQ